MAAVMLTSGCPVGSASPDGGNPAPSACVHGEPPDDGFDWKLPPNFPRPPVPNDNPMNAAKVELGRHLFYDTRLSLNHTRSCASCHVQSRAFTDGEPAATGATGDVLTRNAMTIANVGYASALTWANAGLLQLEDQALVPLLGTHPVELGMAGQEAELVRRLQSEPRYQALFPRAFAPSEEPFSVANAIKAISAFERTVLSGGAPYDLFRNGETGALSLAAQRGRALFNSARLECFHCHSGFNLQDTVNTACSGGAEPHFHNTGLYNLRGTGD